MIDWKSIDDDGLPPAGIPLLVTVDRGNMEGPRRVVIGPVYYMKTSFGGQWRFCEHGNEEHTIGPEYAKVTAWDEWPTPYWHIGEVMQNDKRIQYDA